jgi:DNA-binding NtrC family response regulator
MPSAVIVVHDERNTRELAVVSLRVAFLEVTAFEDPMTALDAIEEASSCVRVLITRVAFEPGKLNGIALARMVRMKRPGTKVVFVALAEYAAYVEGLGGFLSMPLDPAILVETVSRLLVTQNDVGAAASG